jgi:hypothetical protein
MHFMAINRALPPIIGDKGLDFFAGGGRDSETAHWVRGHRLCIGFDQDFSPCTAQQLTTPPIDETPNSVSHIVKGTPRTLPNRCREAQIFLSQSFSWYLQSLMHDLFHILVAVVAEINCRFSFIY